MIAPINQMLNLIVSTHPLGLRIFACYACFLCGWYNSYLVSGPGCDVRVSCRECWRGARPRSPGCDQGWGPSCAPDIGGSSVAAGPLERALEHDGDKTPGSHNSHNTQLFFRFCSSLACCSPVVMARNIQLRSTSSFTKICQKMMMMFSKSCLSASILGLFNCNSC